MEDGNPCHFHGSPETLIAVEAKAATQRQETIPRIFCELQKDARFLVSVDLKWFPLMKTSGRHPCEHTHAFRHVAAHIRSSSQLLHCCLATPKTGAAHVSSTLPQLLIKPIFESRRFEKQFAPEVKRVTFIWK